MKTSIAICIFLTGGWTGASVVHAAPAAASAAGHWEGTVKMENGDLAMVVDLERNATGAWIGTLGFPGTATVDAPLGDIAVDEKSVHFTARVPAVATFHGALSPDASRLEGLASNTDGDTTFQLARNGAAVVKLPPPSTPLPKEFAGTWQGTSESDGKTKHVGLKLATAADGLATATLIALDHGNLEIPVSTVSVEGRRLRFESRAISGRFEGALGDDGEITGEWIERAKRAPLTFKPQSPTTGKM